MGKVQSNTTKKVINSCRRGVKASPTWDTLKQAADKLRENYGIDFTNFV